MKRRHWILLLVGAVGLLSAAVIPNAAAHTPDQCARVRVAVADDLLVLDAAESAGGLTSAQQTQLQRQRAILNAALRHCPAPSPSPSQPPSPSPSVSPSPSASSSSSAAPSPTPSSSSSSPAPVGWPGPDNTGVPDGVTLAIYTGPCTIVVPDTVIDAALINCDLDVRASGVAIKRSRVNGAVHGPAGASYIIEDSEVDGTPGDTYRSDMSSVGDGGARPTVLRSEVVGSFRGIYCANNCVVRDSWIHDQAIQPGSDWHVGGIRMTQGSTIVHNTISCDAQDTPQGGGCSAPLTGYPDFEPIRNNTIDNNLFKATTGGFCAYGGASGGKPFSNDPTNATNIKFRGNVFERGTRNSQYVGGSRTDDDHICGFWGPITDFATNRTGNEWSSNQYDTGEPIVSVSWPWVE
jgi:hypothetical protein